MTFCAAEKKEYMFLAEGSNKIVDEACNSISEMALAPLLKIGVAYIHPGMKPSEVERVKLLFK